VADPAPVRVLSLFSGVGGLDLALRLAVPRARTVCYVEGEAQAVAVLAARMEEGLLDPAPVWGDVSTLDGTALRGAVDLVVAGFPCPPVSVAGKGLGFDDPRWLWPEVVRLVRETRAPFLVVENVRGLLSARDGAVAGTVLGDLADLRFDAEWGVLSAAAVGAPHRRERVFLVGWLADRRGARLQGDRPERAAARAVRRGGGAEVADADATLRVERGSGPARSAPPLDRDAGETVADAGGDGRGLHAGPGEARGEDRGGAPAGSRGLRDRAAGGGVADPDRPDPERPSGLWVPPATRGAEDREPSGPGRRVADHDGGGLEGERLEDPAGELCPPGDELDGRDLPGRERTVGIFPPGPGDAAGWRRVLEVRPDLAPAVTIHEEQAAALDLRRRRGREEEAQPGVRRVAAGLPAGVDASRVDRLRALGNAVVPLQGAVAIRALLLRAGLGGLM
jgi:DNA (cytosine-5)-methyltransferase 1